ncbi:MAG: hypothetical protein VR65_05600 [Desulfobulbaceae bacterium BRH_c16a]|nr:MAG: hypothetical protein VR65_05600 [Desulfobulbaceae bacterium BRH_c16a]
MGKSFQEQLLKLGLVEKKQVKEVRKEQHQKKKQQAGKKAVEVDENVLLARQAEEKKKARARELNLEREAKLQKRADDARIIQLVEEHKLEKIENGVPYRFNYQGTIQRIFVTKEMADRLSDGRLGIISLAEKFEVIPRGVAEKIQSINGTLFISLNASAAGETADPDDPYAEFKIPDDLMW